MEKKKRDVSLPKRFNSEDIKKWQEQANLTTGGNLTLWMENALNDALKKENPMKSDVLIGMLGECNKHLQQLTPKVEISKCFYMPGTDTSARCIHCGKQKWEHQ
jgi:hypothetical protein